jgi:hypothetical protein
LIYKWEYYKIKMKEFCHLLDMRNDIKLVDFDMLRRISGESQSRKSQYFIGTQKEGSSIYILMGDLTAYMLDATKLKTPSGDVVNLCNVEIMNGGLTLNLGNGNFTADEVFKVAKSI